MKPLAELTKLFREITDLSHVSAVLGWDQHTCMPKKGAAGRAEQLATLGRITHTKIVNPRIGKLLDTLESADDQTHGSKFKPRELLRRITGGDIDPEPYLKYLEKKFREIYGLG